MIKQTVRRILFEFVEEISEAKKMFKDEFIRRASTKHNNKFNYDKVEYVNGTTKVIITCPIHGDFLQTPQNHLNGGCKKCADSNRDYAKMSKDEFIKRANIKHNNKFDYSNVNYDKVTEKIDIICPIHGTFRQQASSHLQGTGCSQCSGLKKMNNDEFIEKAKQIHGDKFDYSQVNYKNTSTKVKILCPVHGEFSQTPNSHLQGVGCKKCAFDDISKKLSRPQQEYIEKVEKIHNGKYSYEKTNYTTAHDKIIVTCPIHGDFSISANKHFRGGGCSKCSGSYMDQDYFVEKANTIHNNKYDYSLVNYVTNKTPVKIICPIHGTFLQAPGNHINQGQGCPDCGTETAHQKTRLTQEEFISRAQNVHANKFDYSNLNYKSLKDDVKIICPKHGEFEQNANNHLLGFGCPKCSESRGEKIVSDILKNNNIKFERQKRFEHCFNIGPKGKCTRLPMDFYLPEYNAIVEYDGKQHFEPIETFGGENAFKTLQIRDQIKNTFCKENNIKMIRIDYRLPFSEIAPYILSELGINSV